MGKPDPRPRGPRTALRVVGAEHALAPSDAELVVAARARDASKREGAREALCRRHAPSVIRLAHRLLGRDDEADDLAQEAFTQALSSLDRLEDPQAFAAWIRTIVVRTAHKIVRRRMLVRRFGLGPRRTETDIDTDFISHDAPPDVHAELRAIYTLLDALPARERIALVLRRVEGLSHEDVAEQLGVSLSTAKRLAASSDEALARALGGDT